MHGLDGKIYFVERQETNQSICSLSRIKDEIVKEEVIRVADCSILALELDTEDLYFFDDKGRLHRLKNGRE